MENYKLNEDINLFCVKAASFPDGIKAAHDRLISITKGDPERNYYGVSYMYDDKILYMAGAQTLVQGEPTPEGCEPFTLKKGDYTSIYIPDFGKNLLSIEKAFKKLLDHPGIDEEGCCVECYLPQGCNFSEARDMRCMVRLAD